MTLDRGASRRTAARAKGWRQMPDESCSRRRGVARPSLLAWIAISAFGATAPALGATPDASGTCTYTKEVDVPAIMRDGTILRANVITPDAPGTYGVVLMRLPYNKDGAEQFP